MNTAPSDPSDGVAFAAEGVVADLYHPAGTPRAVAIVAHGAGGNRQTLILRAYANELSGRGLLVALIDLPYRQRRPKGPPNASGAAADRDGIRAAIAAIGGQFECPLIVGGHSYGGRQASIVVAEDPGVVQGLLLSSYPLHPPGKPERARTEHLPQISIPTVLVHGSTDPFATTAELTEAIALIPAPTRLVEINKTGHDLKPDKNPTARLAADAIDELILAS
ncbi:MAG: alpha/beta hydrolase [Gordonia sp. (in: high G+C Gram-positive bacteria)]